MREVCCSFSLLLLSSFGLTVMELVRNHFNLFSFMEESTKHES